MKRKFDRGGHDEQLILARLDFGAKTRNTRGVLVRFQNNFRQFLSIARVQQENSHGQFFKLLDTAQRNIMNFFVLRKKGSKTKERMKEEEIEKGDRGPPTRKVFFQNNFRFFHCQQENSHGQFFKLSAQRNIMNIGLKISFGFSILYLPAELCFCCCRTSTFSSRQSSSSSCSL